MNQQNNGYQKRQPQQATALVVSPAKPITSENSHLVLSNIQDFFPPDKFNTIKPIQQLTPANMKGMRPDIKVLDLRQHCYDQSGKKALTKSGILQLADAYEVYVKQVDHEYVRGAYVKFSFVASMIRNGVTLIEAPGTQVIDVDVESELILLDYEEKAEASERASKSENPIPYYKPGHIYQWNKWKNYYEDKGHWERVAKREILRMKKNMVRMCESKAMLAAMRNILGVQAVYTTEEIEKPFVAFRLEPDYSQMSPDQIMALREQAQNAKTILTGNAPQPFMDVQATKPEPVQETENDLTALEAQELEQLDEELGDYIDVEYGEMVDETPQETQQQAVVDSQPGAANTASQNQTFSNESGGTYPVQSGTETVLPRSNNGNDLQQRGSGQASVQQYQAPAETQSRDTVQGSGRGHGETFGPNAGHHGNDNLRGNVSSNANNVQLDPGNSPQASGGNTEGNRPGDRPSHAVEPVPESSIACAGCGARLSSGIVKFCMSKQINPPRCMKCQPKN